MCAGLTQRTAVQKTFVVSSGLSFPGARFFRAPTAYRGGQADFPTGHKQTQDGWARRKVRRAEAGCSPLRRGLCGRHQPHLLKGGNKMSARFSRTSLAAIVAAPMLVGAGALATFSTALA